MVSAKADQHRKSTKKSQPGASTFIIIYMDTISPDQALTVVFWNFTV